MAHTPQPHPLPPGRRRYSPEHKGAAPAPMFLGRSGGSVPTLHAFESSPPSLLHTAEHGPKLDAVISLDPSLHLHRTFFSHG
jgi:hypothetical protein